MGVKTENMVKSDALPFTLTTFFEMTPDLVCIAGKDGFFKEINPAVVQKLGYTKKELMSRPIESFIHPDDRDMTARERAALLNGKALLNFQNRYLTKEGSAIWLEWTSIYFRDEEVVFAIAKDITQKKLIEQEVEEKYNQFKSLATHFKSSIEEDRKYLANELHAELAQLAAVLKMDIGIINTHLPEMTGSPEGRIQHAMVVAELLINTIRRISFSISPHMIEDLGLNATLEYHCGEFSILNGIPCRFENAYEEAVLTQEIKIDFFRICQEALTNILEHAMASRATVRIEEAGGHIRLLISDDGKGFDIDRLPQQPGLTRMRERARSINGELTIESRPGKGTTIGLTVAL